MRSPLKWLHPIAVSLVYPPSRIRQHLRMRRPLNRGVVVHVHSAVPSVLSRVVPANAVAHPLTVWVEE